MKDILQIRPAVADDVRSIIGMIDEAAEWLETKGTDQWAIPWPDEEARDDRVRQGAQAGKTWMVEDNGVLAGTITARDQGNPILWTPKELLEPSVYISRLIVTRKRAGSGIGAALIDWAGLHGIRAWDARWIRVDVWTSNSGLHNYYRNQGFEYVRTCPFKNSWDYPSAALFQKQAARIDEVAAANFKEVNLA
jgi:GNAT superfamily N-acetyltransferase